MIGKLLGGATRILNIPAEAFDRVLGDDLSQPKDEDRTVSAPLEAIAKTFDSIDDPTLDE